MDSTSSGISNSPGLLHAVQSLETLSSGWAAISHGGRSSLVTACNGALTLREFSVGVRRDDWEAAGSALCQVNAAMGELWTAKLRLSRILDGMSQAVERIRNAVDADLDAGATAVEPFATLPLAEVEGMAEELLDMHRADFGCKVGILDSVLDESITRNELTQSISKWMTQPCVVKQRATFILEGLKADALAGSGGFDSPARPRQRTPTKHTTPTPTKLKPETLDYLLS